MCNGNTPILKEKVSGPMSFYHLKKKDGEKNIYLFGDVHQSSDNICDIKDTNSDLFHIFVEKLYKKYPRISFDIGFEDYKYKANFLNETTPIAASMIYFRDTGRLKEREKSDKEEPSQLVRFHYMDIRSQANWHKKDESYFNIIHFFETLKYDAKDIKSLKAINWDYHMDKNELKEHEDKIIKAFNYIIKDDIKEIDFDKFKTYFYKSELNIDYDYDSPQIQKIVDLFNTFDISRGDIFIKFSIYSRYVKTIKEELTLLFQNNESIIQNYINKKNTNKNMLVTISEESKSCNNNAINDLYICDLKYECNKDICVKSEEFLEKKLENTLIIMIKKTKIYTKVKNYEDFPLTYEVINAYIETRIKKIIKNIHDLRYNKDDFHNALKYLKDCDIFEDLMVKKRDGECKNNNIFQIISSLSSNILVFLMDLYSIIRISKKYQKNVILYFGQTHIENIKDFFLDNEYELVYSDIPGYDLKHMFLGIQPNRCVKIGDSFTEDHLF